MSQEEFNKALLAAQQEFPPIHKTKTAEMGNYSYKYADLGDVFESILPILHKHGIVLVQPAHSEAGYVGVSTRLLHESGYVEFCGDLMLPAGNNPQAAGSAMTYARRYAACAALGIVADEDDDGRSASVPESDYVETPQHPVEEQAKRGTNKLKAEALEITGDATEAQRLWDKALLDLGLYDYVNGVLPLGEHDAVREKLQELGP